MTETAEAEHLADPALTRPDLMGPRLVEATGDARWNDLEAVLIAGGKSNLTFALRSGAGELVLRRPPTGDLLPSAHDMRREVTVQQALADTLVPVPRVVLADLDGDLLGVPSYVMTKAEGVVVRDTLPAGWAENADERRRASVALVETLATLHSVDAGGVGLGSFGRPEGFLARQVARWTRQWEASRTSVVAEVDELARGLAAREPRRPGVGVVHGDFRLDNCVMAASDPGRVVAVLDWEMATLGDPLTDLAMLLFYWREPGEEPTFVPAVTDLGGFMGRSEVAEHYASLSGTDLEDLDLYLAFAHFKFAVIAQGIAARVAGGAMAGQDFGDLRGEVLRCARAGLHHLRKGM
ncbi:phosphotransferase family protein [Nocardioides currus]|uniref:Phosphotransferase family protein n=1 Tax=Nocardioides currus TaxID=2133958 RepID=A0A2R7Z2C9_9ACTN|nr:phosphotransferase family protein [Nocardioides currus]PUA82795.1 phosphotransferase family protein [Nocardioides currus]